MDFEAVQREWAKRYEWHLDRKTFQGLDEDTWICKVTTMWHSAKGEPEATFYLLYSSSALGYQQFTFSEQALPALLDWCLKMSTNTKENP